MDFDFVDWIVSVVELVVVEVVVGGLVGELVVVVAEVGVVEIVVEAVVLEEVGLHFVAEVVFLLEDMFHRQHSKSIH